MASLLKAAAHYTNIWRDEPPLFYGHNVDAPQSLSPKTITSLQLPLNILQATESEGFFFAPKQPSFVSP